MGLPVHGDGKATVDTVDGGRPALEAVLVKRSGGGGAAVTAVAGVDLRLGRAASHGPVAWARRWSGRPPAGFQGARAQGRRTQLAADGVVRLPGDPGAFGQPGPLGGHRGLALQDPCPLPARLLQGARAAQVAAHHPGQRYHEEHQDAAGDPHADGLA
ncbi:hypothetical protein [Nocardiopsis sp. CC223A]|uniref:hypothetical protein n=1 Tax=Nocardiopsis sp. CC223A TaxID=3044051 RepID=UPI00278C7B14|nr:hypothetical protein [Nocardiopsis sp. CC223A]